MRHELFSQGEASLLEYNNYDLRQSDKTHTVFMLATVVAWR